VTDLIRAPFTPEQVTRLNRFQGAGVMHPFTCGAGDGQSLVATEAGWVCPVCDYTQDWAHAFMAGTDPVAVITDPPPTITCPRCGMTSANPNDIREGYCGHCHDWTTPR